MSVSEAIVQGSPQPAAPMWISVSPGNPCQNQLPGNPCQDQAAQLNTSVTPAIVQEPMQGRWWIFLLDPTWITIVAGMSLLMRVGEWLVKPTQRKSKQPKLETARCDEAAQQKASVPPAVVEPYLHVAGQVTAVCPLVLVPSSACAPIMVADQLQAEKDLAAQSWQNLEFNKATRLWQGEFHDWVRMLWYSEEWYSTNADTPIGGWAKETTFCHYNPEDGDVVISRQEFARLLWRCASMGDRAPICQWVAPDECPNDIAWRT